MNKSSCDTQLQNSISNPPKLAERICFFSAIVANIVLNGCLCYTATVLDILTIHTLRKTSALSKPLETFLPSLAASDLGVGYTGLLGQLLHIALLLLRCNFSDHTILVASACVVVNIVFLSLLFNYSGLKYRNNHCHSKASKIPKYCYLKTSCYTVHHHVTLVITIWLCSAILALSFAVLFLVKINIIAFSIIESLCFVAKP